MNDLRVVNDIREEYCGLSDARGLKMSPAHIAEICGGLPLSVYEQVFSTNRHHPFFVSAISAAHSIRQAFVDAEAHNE